MRILVLPALIASAPVLAREQPATEAEKTAAMSAYTDCFLHAAQRLDDRISDAMTIGRAIAPGCRAEQAAVAEALSRGQKRGRVRIMLQDRLQSHEAEDAAAVVLTVRRSKTARN